MKFLYYSTSYYANHGGSIQSIEFFKNLDEVAAVTEKFIFPEIAKVKKPFKKAGKFSIRSFLRKIPLLQILFFYRRNQFYLNPLIKKIKEVNPDVILLQIDSNFLQVKKIRSLFPELLICTQINGSPFDEPFRNIAFKNYFLKKQRKAYEIADVNFFISNFSRKRIMGKFLDPNRDVVIHNGTDVKKFFPIQNKDNLKKKWDYPAHKFILGYIGTLDFHKRLITLIEVFNEIHQKNSAVFLMIIGDGPAFAKTRERIKQLKLENSVMLKGWIPHEFINENLNCFDVAVHHYASNYMNPLKIFEYLSAGLPVIAPDIPSIRENFTDKKDLLITGTTKRELKKNLQEIINNETLRNKISNNEHLIHEIEGNYTWKRYAERIVGKMQEAIENKK